MKRTELFKETVVSTHYSITHVYGHRPAHYMMVTSIESFFIGIVLFVLFTSNQNRQFHARPPPPNPTTPSTQLATAAADHAHHECSSIASYWDRNCSVSDHCQHARKDGALGLGMRSQRLHAYTLNARTWLESSTRFAGLELVCWWRTTPFHQDWASIPRPAIQTTVMITYSLHNVKSKETRLITHHHWCSLVMMQDSKWQ